MRIATFNLESFGEDPFDAAALKPRLDRLRPVLERLEADILCLQEVNAQHRRGEEGRGFDALAELLRGTRYEGFHRATSGCPTPAERHNLVVLSRYPIRAHRDIRHDLVEPPHWVRRHAEPPDTGEAPAICFDRPILAVTVDLPEGRPLAVFCVHLRAPLAAPVPGQKINATRWKSVEGWAEGYYVAAMKRTGQALELRQAIDAIFDEDPQALIAAVGDFNAVEVESVIRIVEADTDDTGNEDLNVRRMSSVDALIEKDRRYTVRHRGRRHMLDHILASPTLSDRLRGALVFNEELADEVDDSGTDAALGSFHAPLVADFADP